MPGFLSNSRNRASSSPRSIIPLPLLLHRPPHHCLFVVQCQFMQMDENGRKALTFPCLPLSTPFLSLSSSYGTHQWIPTVIHEWCPCSTVPHPLGVVSSSSTNGPFRSLCSSPSSSSSDHSIHPSFTSSHRCSPADRDPHPLPLTPPVVVPFLCAFPSAVTWGKHSVGKTLNIRWGKGEVVGWMIEFN